MRLLPVLLFLITSVAECLMLSRVLVPQYKLYGEDALLRCDYDLGRDRLYAVKWYKDNEEFFRFVPRFNPPIYTHPVEGVRVDNLRSNDKRVLLRSLTVRSTGGYRCEVSAEAPSFASIMGEGRMTVVYLPKDPPQITGHLRSEYEVGNVLDLNCTSAKSFPPAKLSWYINDSPVHLPPSSISIYPASSALQDHLHPTQLVPHNGGGTLNSGATTSSSLISSLMISSLRLQLQLESHHFGPKGTAKVRCVARISPLFWQDGDEKILSGNSNYGNHRGGHHGGGSVSGQQQHGTRHGRKKTLEYGASGEEFEEGNEEHGGYEDKPEVEEGRPKNAHNINSDNRYRGHSHHHNNLGQNRHRGGGSGGGYRHHGAGDGYRREDDEDEREEGDDEDQDEYYGLELPAFQREALVLVRGSCSILKPIVITKILAAYLIEYYLL